MPPDAARRSERSRRAILLAALELVEALGHSGLTIEAVAARAGVGKQTIYRWWPSKGPLLFDAFVEFGPADVDELPSGVLAVDLKRELRAAVGELAERRFDQVCRVLVHEARTDLVTLLLMPRRMALEERLHAARNSRLRSTASTPLGSSSTSAGPNSTKASNSSGPFDGHHR